MGLFREMNTDKINQLLSLSANLAVLIGIVFIVVEMQQANRIALRGSRSELSLAAIELNNELAFINYFKLLNY